MATNEGKEGVGQGPFDEFLLRNAKAIVEQARAIEKTALDAEAHEATAEAANRGIRQALALDVLDEVQIAQEMQGRVITQYFYEFPVGGTRVTGISYAGVKAIARFMAQHGEPVVIEGVEFEEFDEGGKPVIGCLARARNARTGEVRFGYAAQAEVMETRQGPRPDAFAKVKALNKAQRNALRQFIPEVVVVEMFKEWKKASEPKKTA